MVVTLGMVSCSDDDSSGAPQVTDNTIKPAETPTDDQLRIKVTGDLAAYIHSPFDEGSTGDALVKRLPLVTGEFTPDTRLVLLKGSDFDEGSTVTQVEILEMARVYLQGGYIALERPTVLQASKFLMALMVGVTTQKQQDYEQTFGLDGTAAAAAARRSQAVERLNTRMQNLNRIAGVADGATTRAADGGERDLNRVMSEMMIFSPIGYFVQQPFETNPKVIAHMKDSEGDATEPQEVAVKATRTAFLSGRMADAAAAWLNDMLKPRSQKPLTAHRRVNGEAAINEMIDASETFTFSGCINSRIYEDEVEPGADHVNMTMRSWGVHSMGDNKDYYYLQQDVRLIMGETGGSQIYFPMEADDKWYKADWPQAGYDRWFGSWLTRYETSMDLTGSGGTIKLEASAPGTDNDGVMTTISTMSAEVTIETTGISVGIMFGADMFGLLFGWSDISGTIEFTSFSMGTRITTNELTKKVNTNGNKVTWTYAPNQFPLYSYDDFWTVNSAYDSHHTEPLSIISNDCDLSHEICWSVANPTGQYTVNVTSAPQVGALMWSYDRWYNRDVNMGPFSKEKYTDYTPPNGYVFTTTPTESFSHTLLQPNRAIQNWRMYVSVDEWIGEPVTGAKGKIEDALHTQFKDIYAPQIQLGTKSADDLDMINAMINYSKDIFNRNIDILQGIGKDWGVKKYSIYWKSDDMNIETAAPYVVEQPVIPGNKAQAIWCEGNTTLYFAYAPELKAGDTWDGQTVTLVWSGTDVTNSPTGTNRTYPAWLSSIQNQVTRVVFDKSFADVRPTSCGYWFYQFIKLTTIEGIENLNTSEATVMASMFGYCKELTTLNVDGFDMSKVTVATYMFYQCTSLETIYCSQTWNIATSYDMFDKCDKLKGAVSYDKNKINGTMANPETGYFTYPDFAGTITLNEKSSNVPMLKRYEGQRVNVQYSRTLTAKIGDDGNYIATPFTVSLPYDLNLSAAVSDNQVEIYTLAAVTESTGEFIFKKLDITTLEAGVPYLLRVLKGTISLEADRVIISAVKPKSSKVYTSVEEWRRGKGTQVGIWVANFDVLYADDVADDDGFGLQSSDKRWERYVHGGGGGIPAFRGYLSSSSLEKTVYHSVFKE